jgi:DNA-binding MarR family transcriptional regulator
MPRGLRRMTIYYALMTNVPLPTACCDDLKVADPADLSRIAWVQLLRVHAKLTRHMERVAAEHHLTLAQFEMLIILWKNEGISQQELAQRLLVTKGNVCTVLCRMEKSRWVKRDSNPADGRAYRLRLTDEGRRIINSAYPHLRGRINCVMGTLSEKQLSYLTSILKDLESAPCQE